MGPLHSRSGEEKATARFHRAGGSSMGPLHSRSGERRSPPSSSSRSSSLQWGRCIHAAERSCSPPIAGTSPPSFNGAAAFTQRRVVHEDATLARLHSELTTRLQGS